MSETENFLTAVSQQTVEPYYVLAISFDDDDTDITYVTSHAAAIVPTGTAAIDRIDGAVMPRGISGQSQRVAPEKAQHTIGSVTFKLLDVEGELSNKVKDKLDAGEGLRKKRVQLYEGEAVLTSWDDYTLRLTYLIENLRYKDGMYTLTCSDIQRSAKTNIFIQHQGVLSSTISATATAIPVTIAGAVDKYPVVEHDGIYSAHPSQSVGYIIVDNEVIAHSGWTDGSYNALQVVERGALNTLAVKHVVTASESDKKKKVDEYIYLEMSLVKLIYAILTGILHSQTGTLPEHWHLSIPTKYVRLADFIGIGSDLWDLSTDGGFIVRFIGLTKQVGKAFIEKELSILAGLFLRVHTDGAYGVKRLGSVLPYSGYSHLIDEDQIIEYTDLVYDQSAVINNISVSWNWLESQERFAKINKLIDTNSTGKYGEAPEKEFSFKGLFLGVHSDTDLQNYFNTIRDRHAAPPLRLSLNLLPQWRRLVVGDAVRVKNQHIWDYNAGAALDRVFEVQSAKTDWISGKVKVDLFGGVEPAEAVSPAGSHVMQDAYYTAEGTELSTVLTITAGVVTASGSLTGANNHNNAIYYYNGDLTVNAGVVITCGSNVQLRIKGTLVVNGDGGITSKGSGMPGGAGGAGDTYNGYLATPQYGSFPVAGVAGEFGSTVMQESASYYNRYYVSQPRVDINSYATRTMVTQTALLTHTLQGAYAPPVDVAGRDYTMGTPRILNPDGLSIKGLRGDLRGTGGCGGAQAFAWPASGYASEVASGGAGGAGGGGLVIVCRGLAFGASGSIDTSGGDGGAAVSGGAEGRTIYAAGGAGGYPGACVVLIDGAAASPLKSNFKTSCGVIDIPAAAHVLDWGTDNVAPVDSGESVAWGDFYHHASDEHKEGMLYIGYIPVAMEPFDWYPAEEAEEIAGGYGNPPTEWDDLLDSTNTKPDDNANETTDTNQLTDGAGLGNTANWPQVTGDNLPDFIDRGGVYQDFPIASLDTFAVSLGSGGTCVIKPAGMEMKCYNSGDSVFAYKYTSLEAMSWDKDRGFVADCYMSGYGGTYVRYNLGSYSMPGHMGFKITNPGGTTGTIAVRLEFEGEDNVYHYYDIPVAFTRYGTFKLTAMWDASASSATYTIRRNGGTLYQHTLTGLDKPAASTAMYLATVHLSNWKSVATLQRWRFIQEP